VNPRNDIDSPLFTTVTNSWPKNRVAHEPPRRERDEHPQERGGERDEGDDPQRRPVDVELGRGEHRVPVGAEAVEGDVAEVEQAGPADGDVEPQREQHVEERVEADAEDVAVARKERKRRRREHEQGEPGRLGQLGDPTLERPERAAAVGPPGDPRHPLVAADPRTGVARLDRVETGVHQTFATAARPNRPLGRRIITAIRITNTIASEKVEETYPIVSDWASPIRRPPATAPGMLPIPPTTAAVNA
jgi:hypothetical protein